MNNEIKIARGRSTDFEPASADPNTIYFLEDSLQVFVGSQNYSNKIQKINDISKSKGLQGKLYLYNNSLYTYIDNAWKHICVIEWDKVIEQTGPQLLSYTYNSSSYPTGKLIPISQFAQSDDFKKIFQYRSPSCNQLIKCCENTIFYFKSKQFIDSPELIDGIFICHQISSTEFIYLIIFSNNNIWYRIINNNEIIIKDWKQINSTNKLNILTIGDDILYKMNLINILKQNGNDFSSNHSTISNEISIAPSLIQQLEKNKQQDIDVIIACGGINDYFTNALLGEVSLIPVSTDLEAETLDQDTLSGALEYLFYKMIKLYPNAKRYFLIPHKIWKTNESIYCPVTRNSAGWTQEDLYKVVAKCCNIYNVQIIDIYNNSNLNSVFDVYHDGKFINKNGIYPTDLGYEIGYIPIIKQSLGLQ